MSIDLMNRQFDRTDDRPSSEADSSHQLEDSLTLYARGVGRVPMLSPAEERELFRRKEAGDERAKRILIEANLRLVIWIARQYAHRNVPMLDLIQEGNLALTRAVERFDHRLGFRLSTYATLTIKRAVGQAAERHASSSSGSNLRRQANSKRSKSASGSPAAPESRSPAGRDRCRSRTRIPPRRGATRLRAAARESRVPSERRATGLQ